jgi:KDO2-lipid IV(A) lauroyltransferase
MKRRRAKGVVGQQMMHGVRQASSAVIGFLAVGALRFFRLSAPEITADICGRVLRWLGPLLPEHRLARANLAAAFPEKSADEINAILRGVWDNLGRVGVEFAHIDRLWDYDSTQQQHLGRIMESDESERIVLRLRDDGKPALIFSAHLANWEVAAVAAKSFGLETSVLFRRPNIRAIADEVTELRKGCMGTLIPTGLDAPVRIAEALERGSHLAILVDQYFVRGVPVTFFGRRTMANPLIARLARHFECPIHGVRVVRHDGNRFRIEITEAIAPARDAEGKIDIEHTMQIITDVVEGWVREHPEQWLWLHRRWR